MSKQNTLAKTITVIAGAMAKKGCNTASMFGIHQAKEPKKSAK